MCSFLLSVFLLFFVLVVFFFFLFAPSTSGKSCSGLSPKSLQFCSSPFGRNKFIHFIFVILVSFGGMSRVGRELRALVAELDRGFYWLDMYMFNTL